ncbi:hypothetical protein CPLU01_06642 [Colletotrichum plurivorum]|uniref:Uncharacterized protein n=1 Tax=Colletotrichum plurivorum TaxID=2175906 RepID=A0A8H6NG47_9PEZI|nr:hypothetical protein CPLU01_06642 [Colletotrichum plurivorum]
MPFRNAPSTAATTTALRAVGCEAPVTACQMLSAYQTIQQSATQPRPLLACHHKERKEAEEHPRTVPYANRPHPRELSRRGKHESYTSLIRCLSFFSRSDNVMGKPIANGMEESVPGTAPCIARMEEGVVPIASAAYMSPATRKGRRPVTSYSLILSPVDPEDPFLIFRPGQHSIPARLALPRRRRLNSARGRRDAQLH